MFCYQCEQTAKGEGCTVVGVCGKDHTVASLQDLLIHLLKGLSQYAVEGRKVGVTDREVNTFTFEALFATVRDVCLSARLASRLPGFIAVVRSFPSIARM